MKPLYPRVYPAPTRNPFRFISPFYRRMVSGVSLLALGLTAQAQTTPLSGTTTFNTISIGNYIEYAQSANASAGFTATNVENSGWDISGYTTGADDYVIAGENWGSSSDGGLVYLASISGGAPITSMRFRANDGQLFDLNALDLGYDVNGSNTSFTITGYRSGVAVPGARFSVPAFASFGNGGGWSRGISLAANGNFKGVDEFRITPNTAGVLMALDVDNINATNFRSVAFTQITPADIPASNEGAFTKTIAGQSFTFTPATNNFVSYQNDLGSEGFGGLYAFDYNTADGTDVTLSAPAGYSFDLSSFQYLSDRGTVNLTVTLTFTDNSTDVKSYSLNGNSLVHTLSGFTTAADDVRSIHLVSDGLLYTNNFEVSDVKAMTTLPLRWLQFDATLKGGAVVLNWRTAAEQGTADFVVQHSADGRQWQTLGTVQAIGDSRSEPAYRFVHGSPVAGVNLYRLLQRDADGRSRYSPVVRIDRKSMEQQFRVYPNPVVGGRLNVVLPAAGLVRVYNSLGTLVLQEQLPAGASVLNLGGLSKGVYTVCVKEQTLVVVVP